MTLTERTLELANRFRVSENGIHGKAILAALEETRREAIEEAAEIGNVIYDDAGSSSTHEVSEYRVQTALGVGALRVRDAIRALLDPPDSKRPANLATDGPDAA